MRYQVTDVRANSGDSGFLLNDGTTSILYDSGFGFSGDDLAEKVAQALGGRDLDYIFLTHSHYDHALGAAYVKARWPKATIVAGRQTAEIFARDSVRRHMREMDRKIARKFGVAQYRDRVDELAVDKALADGEEIDMGGVKFTALELPGHTRCSMSLYCPQEKLLLGCETTGVFGGGEEIYPACLVGYQMSLDAIERVRALEIRQIVMPHWGLLSEEQTARYLARAYDRTVEVAEMICGMLRRGKSRAETVEAFKAVFYRDGVSAFYPEEAMYLNTGLMVDLMARELLGEN